MWPSLRVWAFVVVVAAGCSPSNESAAQLGVVRLEVQGGMTAPHDVPAGTDSVLFAIESVDIRVDGAWQTYPESTTIDLLQPDLRPLLRSVPRFSTVDSIRLTGAASLSIAGERVELRIPSARGLQINLDPPALPGQVNRITVALDGTIHQAGGNGWILRPLLHGSVDVDPGAFGSGNVTPQQGGVIGLPNGFQLIVPPGAVTQPVDLHVEAVTDDDTEPFYVLGPAGQEFAVPVEAHVPWADPTDGLTWDAEELPTHVDAQGRVVAENTHLSCIDRKFKETARTIGQGAELFEGKMCGGNYSIGIVPLTSRRLRVRAVLGDPSTATPDACSGQRVFKTASIASFLARTPNPSYAPVIAINGDHIKGDSVGGDVADACPRLRTIVSDDVIRASPIVEFSLGFGAGAAGGTSFGVSTAAEPPRTDFTVIGSLYRYITDGHPDFPNGFRNEPDFITNAGSRATIGVNSDSSYLFMGVANNRWSGMDGNQWALVLLHPRRLTSGMTVTPSAAWRMDEGGTPALAYYDAQAHQTKQASGSLSHPDDTVLAIAVFEGACAASCAAAPVRGWYCGSAQELCWCDNDSQPTAVLATSSCVVEPQGTHDHDAGEPAPCLAACSGAPNGALRCCGEGNLGATCDAGRPTTVLANPICP